VTQIRSPEQSRKVLSEVIKTTLTFFARRSIVGLPHVFGHRGEHKRKSFKVELANQRVEIISVRDRDTPKAWLRDAPSIVVLNGNSYSKKEIMSVSEHKTTKGSTNVTGI
jgi:hypothetical protein